MKLNRIFILEPDVSIAEDLQAVLVENGYREIDIVTSIPESSLFSNAADTCCIIVNIALLKNKKQRRILAACRNLDFPVIIAINRFTGKTADILRESEASAFISLPVRGEELIAAIDLALYNNKKEKQLWEDINRYSLLTENINDVIWLADMNFNILYVSPSVKKVRGYTADEIKKQPFESMLTPDSFEQVKETLKKYFERFNNNTLSIDEYFGGELEFIKKDGSTVWVEVNAKLILDENGNPTGIIGTDRNVTERKKIEDSLKREVEFTRMLMETSPIGIVVLNRNGEITSANTYAEKVLALTRSEIKKRQYNAPEWKITSLDGGPFPDEELPFSIVMQKMKPVFDVKHAIEYPDGKQVMLSINASPVINSEQQLDGMIATIEDITEKIKAENQLKESEERYSMLFNNMIDGYALHEIICNKKGKPIDYRFIDINPAFRELTGLQGEIKGKTIREITPEIEDHWIEIYGDVAIKGDPVRFENYSGALGKWYEVVAYQSGKNRFVTIFVDITERKTAELALKDSEEKFRRLAENAKDMIYRMSLPDGIYEYASPATTDITGYNPDELYENPLLIQKVIHPDWHDYFKKEWENLLKGKMPESYEYQIVHKSGDVRWINQRNVLLKDEKGNPVAIEGIVTDVTEKKLFDKNIIEQKQIAELYFDVAGVIMVVLNDKAEVVRINKKGCSLLGYEADEIIGKNWFNNFLPMEEREEVGKVYRQIMNGNIAPVEYFENAVVARDGTLRTISWHNTMILDDNDQALGTLSSGEDITERKKAEEQLKNSLAEKEILLKEVHHRVKNNMQIISSLIHLLGDSNGADRNEDFVKEVEGRIRSMALIHEMIYKSDNYAFIDFRNYIEKLMDQLLQSYSLDVSISIDIDVVDIYLDMDTAIPCALIIYELVVNAFKHAFKNREKGIVGITFNKDKEKKYSLTIWDNGIGLPENFNLEKCKTIGFELVQSLTKQLGGSISLEKDGGTVILVNFSMK
jgi:PAS domain S-box-containing protein